MSFVERLVCHPRLPLIAGLDSDRPVVRVWQLEGDGLRELGGVGDDAAAYPPESWERHELTPSVAWHPHEPSLMVIGAAGLRRWTVDGVAELPWLPACADHRDIAFSPDGRTLWVSPSSVAGEDKAWERSDVLDLATGTVEAGLWWDTGIVEHPGGGLLVTLSSEQGATDVLFARPDDAVPAGIRVYRHAIVLDVDGYHPPVFSSDGRYLALRGNAYVQSLDVFEFPTLRKVLHTAFGDPYPGFPYPPEWLEEQALWSSHNIAFAPGAAVLLAGSPQGNVIEFDLEGERVSRRAVTGAAVSALTVTPSGQLVVADRSGRVTVTGEPWEARSGDGAAARERVQEYLAGTAELPGDADLETALLRADGQRTWSADDLETVTEAGDSDPTWLRLRAAMNTHDLGRE
ncbi:hypothetical protein ACFPIJ_22380 [Dactylosporangium cerinum]|uniref:WD40 repeat domain-containing protein n=1 Tax=Dactylosporangium cerinum TaxID=1434730 RepID=A0ABV9VVY2_9ACTN